MIIEVHLLERKNILQRASSFAILPTRTKAFMMVSKVLAPKARSYAKLYAHLRLNETTRKGIRTNTV